MSRPLWDKGNASDEQMMRYTARDDFVLDQRLLRHDLKATAAHVRGLQRIGVLTLEEVAAMENALETLDQRCRDGQFQLTEADEDGHSAIEAALVEALGETGKKVHTGRSRNDQVLVALRLYEKEALDAIILLPLLIAAAGIICSIVGTFFVKVKEGGNPQHALDFGAFGAAGLAMPPEATRPRQAPDRWSRSTRLLRAVSPTMRVAAREG